LNNLYFKSISQLIKQSSIKYQEITLRSLPPLRLCVKYLCEPSNAWKLPIEALMWFDCKNAL